MTVVMQDALHKVKKIPTNSPVLASLDYSREFLLYVNSCEVGAGASLMQEGEDGIEHPASYYSKKYNRHQQNYAIVEKALALSLARGSLSWCSAKF